MRRKLVGVASPRKPSTQPVSPSARQRQGLTRGKRGPDYRTGELAPPERSMSASCAAPSRPRSARATAK